MALLKSGVFVRTVAAGAGLVALAGAASASEVVYQNDFEAPVGSEWSASALDMTPSGRGYLGQFGNQDAVLTLTGLPESSQVRLEFDLYIIGTWDGNAAPGPDRWILDILGGGTLLNTTFAVGDENSTRMQAYPNSEDPSEHVNRTGAIENNTLGYFTYGFARDAVWHMDMTFAHDDPTLSLKFSAMGLQQLSDESWGLDNVIVTLVPAPGALALMGLGGLAIMRRRR
jgi:hypothetical protein